MVIPAKAGIQYYQVFPRFRVKPGMTNRVVMQRSRHVKAGMTWDRESNKYKRMYLFFKRIFDLALSIIALILVSPVFIVVMPILKFTGEGWVFFVQERVGMGNSRLGLLKFATMLRDSPKLGTVTAMNDPRILPVGRFLRATKINELPQILNVVNGDMAIVGPLPEVKKFTNLYTDEEKVILTVRAEITDWASIWNSNEASVLAGAEDPDRAYMELIRPKKIALQLE